MPKVIVPSNIDTRLYNTLRQIVQELDDTGTNIPLLKTLAQVRNIPNETSAYLILGGTLYRYTKIDGKLFREEVGDDVVPSAYGTILGDPRRIMPIDVDPTPIIITDPVEPIPPVPDPDPITLDPAPLEPTEITISDIIDDSVGDINVNLLEVREVTPNGEETIPVLFLTIDGKLYYCAEGSYFQKQLNIDVTVGDDNTRGESQRPTVSIDAPSTHSGEPFTVTIPFNKEVSGFTLSEIQVEGATLRDFSGNGKTYRVVVAPTGTDNIRLFIPSNIVTDRNFLHNIASDRITVNYQAADTVRPSMSIFAPGSYQGTTPFQIRIRSSEVVTGFIAADMSVVNATISNFRITGMTNTVYLADLTPLGTGIITINIPENVCQDANGNMNTAARQQQIITVPSPARNLVLSTGNGSITARFDTSANDHGSPIQSHEIRIGTQDWIDIGRRTEYTFSGLTNGQAYQIQVRTRNLVGLSPVISASATPVSSDSQRPTITISAPNTYRDGVPFTLNVNASEAIVNFDATDVTAVGATASNSIGADATRSVTITPTGTGTITLSIAANVCQDTSGNQNLQSNVITVAFEATATVPAPARNLVLTIDSTTITAAWNPPISDGGAPITDCEIQLDSGAWTSIGLATGHVFSSLINGQTYTVRVRYENSVGYSSIVSATATPSLIDNTRPTVEISAPSTHDGSAFVGRIFASEVIFNFDETDVDAVNATVSNVSGSSFRRQFTVTPSGTDDVQLSIPANAFQDGSNNQNYASNTVTVTHQSSTTAPLPPRNLSLLASDDDIVATWIAPLHDGGSAITDVEVQLDSGSWTSVGLVTTHTFSDLTTNQSYTVRVRYVNAIGRSGSVSATVTTTQSDNVPPTFEITAPERYSEGDTFVIGIKASKSVPFMLSNLTVIGGRTGNLQQTGNSYTCEITPTAQSLIQISIRANAVRDASGNGNLPAGPAYVFFTFRPTAPEPVSSLRVIPRDKSLQAIWGPTSNNGGSQVRNYQVRISDEVRSGVPYFKGEIARFNNRGLTYSETFIRLTNGTDYTIDVQVVNAVGASTVVTRSNTPVPPRSGDPVHHRLIIDFDNNIIGNPELERQFWQHQGLHFTCAAMAVGGALASLGVVNQAFDVVREATKIVDTSTQQPLGDIVIDSSGNIIDNTPGITNQGEALYYQQAEQFGQDRYRLGTINWNIDVYPFRNPPNRLLTDEEKYSYSGWSAISNLLDFYEVDYHIGYCYDFSWLVRELEAGNKVVAYVDAAFELWGERGNFIRQVQAETDMTPIAPGNTQYLPNTTGENHAIWITGIDLKDPANPVIIINDSGPDEDQILGGRGSNGPAARYSLREFLAAWEDAEFIYTGIGSSELPDTPTIDGAELDREHRELQRIFFLHKRELLDIGGLETFPFFDLRLEQAFLDQIGIRERYNAYVAHVAREQQRIVDAYGLDPTTFRNVLDVLDHE